VDEEMGGERNAKRYRHTKRVQGDSLHPWIFDGRKTKNTKEMKWKSKFERIPAFVCQQGESG
jgi:hypothetical protein